MLVCTLTALTKTFLYREGAAIHSNSSVTTIMIRVSYPSSKIAAIDMQICFCIP